MIVYQFHMQVLRGFLPKILTAGKADVNSEKVKKCRKKVALCHGKVIKSINKTCNKNYSLKLINKNTSKYINYTSRGEFK